MGIQGRDRIANKDRGGRKIRKLCHGKRGQSPANSRMCYEIGALRMRETNPPYQSKGNEALIGARNIFDFGVILGRMLYDIDLQPFVQIFD